MARHLENLTLASAKHLMSQGHITPEHHARIVRKVSVPGGRKKPPVVRGFGSLAQQAQAPIPATDSGPSVTPPGTASGYE